MDDLLLDALGQWIGSPVLNHSAVGGGDISRAYKVSTKSDVFFCKVQMKSMAYDMFEAERIGLDAIRNTGVILAPRVYACEKWGDGAVLIMEHVASKMPTESEYALFGRQLAYLHQQSKTFFGWDSDNYIGSLPQSNTKHKSWPEFYVNERLQPQLILATEQGLLDLNELPEESTMLSVMNTICADIPPSLLHGDLWSGNYLISTDGRPYLIDPAVYQGHSEIDIAMSKLFGGFGSAFYRAYHNVIAEDQFSSDRLKLYQLYYLLVHLNLFGRSYYSGVKAIIKSYF